MFMAPKGGTGKGFPRELKGLVRNRKCKNQDILQFGEKVRKKERKKKEIHTYIQIISISITNPHIHINVRLISVQ